VILGGLPQRPLDAVGAALVLGQTLPLAWRRSRPLACLGLVGAAFAAHQLGGYPASSAGLGLFVALYSAGAHLPRHRRAAVAAGVAGYAALCLALLSRGSPERPVDFLTFLPVLAACWAAGAWVRARVEAEAQRRQAARAEAVAQERVRIARELHDVVTHHVTAMIVQADATQVLLPEQAGPVTTGLAAIGDTGRQAMQELRHMLSVLDAARGQDDPGPASGQTPAVGRIGDLVARARSAGQPVELRETGGGQPVTDATELAVYRLVQEGLTNALRHAPGCPTVVTVDRGEDAVTVAVRDAGPGRTTPSGPDRGTGSGTGSGGRGLAGLRERVAVLGGELRAGPRADGGFEVSATVPSRQRP
jgi:signal transduction histidine kinase